MEFLKEPLFWIIFIGIVVIILSFFIGRFIVACVYSSSLDKKIDQKVKSLHLLVVSYYDSLVNLVLFLNEKEIPIPSKISTLLLKVDKQKEGFENSVTRKELIAILNEVRNGLYMIVKEKGLDYPDMNSIDEFDNNYREKISLANVDINAYNYWVNLLGYRFIFKMMKRVRKENLG